MCCDDALDGSNNLFQEPGDLSQESMGAWADADLSDLDDAGAEDVVKEEPPPPLLLLSASSGLASDGHLDESCSGYNALIFDPELIRSLHGGHRGVRGEWCGPPVSAANSLSPVSAMSFACSAGAESLSEGGSHAGTPLDSTWPLDKRAAPKRIRVKFLHAEF
jgi:hypothetical protein